MGDGAPRVRGKEKKASLLKKTFLNCNGRRREEVTATMQLLILVTLGGSGCTWANSAQTCKAKIVGRVLVSMELPSPVFPFPGAPAGPKGNELCSPISTLECGRSGRPSAPGQQSRREARSSHQRAGCPGPQTCLRSTSF